MRSSYQHIFKYMGLFGGVQGLNILVGLIRNKAIAMILGPTGVGLISIYNTAISLLQNSTNFGLQISGVREISQAYDANDAAATDKHISLLRSWSLLAALLGFALTLAISGVLSMWAFSSFEHTMHFACLSVVVAMAAIAGGETAILKATRQLKPLAKTSALGVFMALIISVPLFLKWGYDGIIPSLIIVGLVQMLLVMFYSYRFYPLHIMWRWREMKAGKPMLTIGTAFVLAGIFGSGAEFAVRAYLSGMSVSLSGLYNAGYMITMTYAGMVFAAMETDYYPHLSAVCGNTRKMNGAVNKQIEVSVMIITPLLIVLMFGLQILIPLLFSYKFLPVIGMTQITVTAMYFRVVNLPVAYIALAKGDSWSYLLMESLYDLLIVVTVIIGYNNWGLDGTGIALAVTSFVDCLCVIAYCSWKYDLELTDNVLKNIGLQFLLGLISLAVVRNTSGFLYYGVGLVILAISCQMSYRMYKQTMK